MTIAQAIAQASASAPNTIEQSRFIEWLHRLDNQIKIEVFDNYIDEVVYNGYDDSTLTTTKLLVPSPYDELYTRYLEAQIYRDYGEFSKYNNCITEFNAIYKRFQAQYNREHTPQGKHRFKFYGGVTDIASEQSKARESDIAKITAAIVDIDNKIGDIGEAFDELISTAEGL